MQDCPAVRRAEGGSKRGADSREYLRNVCLKAHFNRASIAAHGNKKRQPKLPFSTEPEGSYFMAQPVTSDSALPISARERTVSTPASSRAANFSSAVPLPPEMIAPAWPMRLPAGAVTPAM